MSSSPNQAQATFWEDVAGTWLASLGHVALIGSPFGRIAMERLGPIGGARSATARAGELGVSNIEFMVADVQEAPLEAKSFDAAFSQFGVMFFEDPVAAFANVRRLIGDEGVCCFACWQNLFVNEWMMVPGAAFLEATGQAPSLPGPDGPGPFSLSEPDRIVQVLTDAGFGNVEISSDESVAAIPEADLDSLVSLGARTGPVRDFLRDADDAIRDRVVHDVRGKLRERVASGTLRLSAAAFVVRAEG